MSLNPKVRLLLRLIAAGILAQTLFFKFTAAPESVWIFTKLGVEPWGRLVAGFSELVAVVLLLIPRTQFLGAFAALGIMSGALLSHFAILGIQIEGDHGLLFVLGLITFICSALVFFWRPRWSLRP
jgi:hypothetical protein